MNYEKKGKPNSRRTIETVTLNHGKDDESNCSIRIFKRRGDEKI